MPTIESSKNALFNLIGKKLNDKELEKVLNCAKSEVSFDNDALKLEIADVNRPDLLSIEGIARQMKLGLGIINGLQEFKAKKTRYKIKAVSKTRPLIVAAVIKNIRFDNESTKSIIQLQEKLCEIFGRKRKEAALGIYDFDRIKFPLTYKDVEPDKIRFIPLGFNMEMTGREILSKHPAGIAYKHLLENEKSFPLLLDAQNEVLSMPPIINSDYSGKITENTKNVFIEVTGFNYRFLLPILNVVVLSLSDRKGIIEEVTINNLATPDLKEKNIRIDLEEINSVLGLQLTAKESISLLKKYGYNAKGNKTLIIDIPCYRQDILDSRDIIEDIAISYGYANFPANKPMIVSEGQENEKTILARKIAYILAGLKFQEISTFTLIGKELHKKMNKKPILVEVENPVSENYCVLRNELMPSIMSFLEKNTTSNFPQKIFEIGRVFEKKDNGTEEKEKLAIASCHEKANFTEIKQAFDYLMRMLHIKYKIEAEDKDEFIQGRCAKIIINNKPVGYIGEISPKILANFSIGFPVALGEIEI